MVAPMKRFLPLVVALLGAALFVNRATAVGHKVESKGKTPGIEMATLASSIGQALKEAFGLGAKKQPSSA